MNTFVLAAISVVVAAVIGYITNYLAIKMLFHPRRAWHIGGRRVPFTPGLIPKRKSEIAVALGRVVSDYLVTTDGLKDMLQQPELRGQLERKLRELVAEWTDKEETLEQIAVRLAGKNAVDGWKRSLERLASILIHNGVRGLWEAGGTRTDGDSFMNRPLSELLDRMHVPLSYLIETHGTERIIDALREELSSLNGLRIIHNVVKQMLDGVGGMMGMLAGMFVDEDKIALKVRDALLRYLRSQEAHDAVVGLLRKQAERLGEQTPAELLALLRERLEWSEAGSMGAKETQAPGGVSAERQDGDAVPAAARSAERLEVGRSGVGAGSAERLESERSGVGEGSAEQLEVERSGVGAGSAEQLESERSGVGEGSAERLEAEQSGVGAGSAEQEYAGAGQLSEVQRTELSADEATTLSDVEWFAAFVERNIPWRAWLAHVWQMTPRDLLHPHKEWLLNQAPTVTERLLLAAADNIERVMRTVNLPKLVQEQVEKFPTEQVETVILSITGKEFKAITWLGAVLGGLIGLFQAALYIGMG